ncbi:hypothetical protein, partial [uncultured Nostoc sp.]
GLLVAATVPHNSCRCCNASTCCSISSRNAQEIFVAFANPQVHPPNLQSSGARIRASQKNQDRSLV